jgi:hypothetical protein
MAAVEVVVLVSASVLTMDRVSTAPLSTVPIAATSGTCLA